MPRQPGEQVVVITGASSGIGRAAAIEFGKRGAAVVLAARNEEALRTAAAEIQRHGGRAHVVVTDVASWPQMDALARHAYEHFGRIDTWVNNAGLSVYGTTEQLTIEEIDRVIQGDRSPRSTSRASWPRRLSSPLSIPGATSSSAVRRSCST